MLRPAYRRLVCLSVSALLLHGIASADSPKHALRYQFGPDAALHYIVRNDSTINVQVGPDAEKVSHSSETGRVLRTISAGQDGTTVVAVMIEYVNLSAGGFDWDSRSGDAPPAQFAGIDTTIGVPLMNITLAPTGAVIAAETNGKAVNKDQLDSTQFDLLPRLPADPVAIGESWTEPFNVDIVTSAKIPKSISMQRTYTLESVEQGIAEIAVMTSILTPIQDPLEEGQLIQRVPSGTLRLDIAQGRLLERVMRLDNKVVGFQGAQSVLHVLGVRQESLGSAEKTATAPAGRVVK